MQPLLSICIPTRNRARFLRFLLQCLVPQVARVPAGTVEIFVRNNASTDDTPAVLAEFETIITCLRHVTTVTDEGFDGNCFNVVQKAKGVFCWLMGDDDAPAVDGLQTILADVAAQDSDLWIYDRVECTPLLAPERIRHWSVVPNGTKIHGTQLTEIRSYLASSRNIGALFSCISCLVVRRASWRLPDMSAPFSYAYIHIFCCWQALVQNGVLTVRHATPVWCRILEADVTPKDGAFKRLAVDLRGYGALARLAAQRDRSLPALVLAAFRRGRSLSVLLLAAVIANRESQGGDYHRMLVDCGYSRFILWLVRHPRPLLLLHPFWLAMLTPFRRLRDQCRLARFGASRRSLELDAP